MTDEQKKPEFKDIHEAMQGVMQRVGYVLKTGKMVAGKTNYSYAGEADLIAALRPALNECGITFAVISIHELNHTQIAKESYYDGNKITKTEYHVTGIWRYRLTHVDSRTEIDVVGLGEGHDSLDKASYKAATGALKYALRQTFILETGDDPDKVILTDDEKEEKKQAEEKAKHDAAEAKLNAAKAWVANFSDKMQKVMTQEEFVACMGETTEHRNRIAKGYPDLIVSIDRAAQEAEDRIKSLGETKASAEKIIDDTLAGVTQSNYMAG